MATYWENSCSFGLRYVSWYGCLIVSLVFSRLGFWSGGLFLIAPFPGLCLLVPFSKQYELSILSPFECFNVLLLPDDQTIIFFCFMSGEQTKVSDIKSRKQSWTLPPFYGRSVQLWDVMKCMQIAL